MPVTAFVPTDEDWATLKTRFMLMVERVIVQHLPYCSSIPVEKHKKHAFYKEMSVKSDIVSLGNYLNEIVLNHTDTY